MANQISLESKMPESGAVCVPQEQSIKSLSQERFGARAQAYVTSSAHAQGADLDRLLAIAQPQPDWEVLDVATGGGHTALKFAPHVVHVVASDITPQMLAAAETFITEQGVHNVSFKLADAENLPFEPNTFDCVTCRIAPHHFADAGRFVREAARVLKPSGLLLVQDHLVPEEEFPACYIEAFEKLRDPSHHRAFNEREWRFMFGTADLRVTHVECIQKHHRFQDWTERQGVAPRTQQCLVNLVQHAPPEVVAWMQPRDFDTLEATFESYHIIIAGQKLIR